jgi:hypothetical protein
MTMLNREHLMCLAAFTVLVAFSGVSRADDTESSEELAQPMTCAQATAFAWFKQQLALPDGAGEETASVPAECGRIYVAIE